MKSSTSLLLKKLSERGKKMHVETVCPGCGKYITIDLTGHIAICPQGGHHALIARRKCTVCKHPLDISMTITAQGDTTHA